MKCMVVEQFGAPLALREREMPVLEENEVLVKVGACGVCRTDLKIWRGTHPLATKVPLVLGHEVAGEIVEVGRRIDVGRIGERVAVYTFLSCGECAFCRSGRENLCISSKAGAIGLTVDGGYADYVKVPGENALSIGNDIPFEEAAIIPDAITTSYHALTAKAKVQPGDVVVIVGAGGLGLHAVQIAGALGALVVAIDVSEKALVLAKDMGAHGLVRVTRDDPTGGFKDPVDTVVDFTGDPQMQSAGLNMLRVGGKFVAVGYNPIKPFEINSQVLVSKDLEVYGSRSCGRDDLKETIRLVSTSKVKPFIGQTYQLTAASVALEELERGSISGRSVLIP
jgi:2-desacetyl-2-hydroxyethyl bacteriochlorophyllide A dehydrogenase